MTTTQIVALVILVPLATWGLGYFWAKGKLTATRNFYKRWANRPEKDEHD